MIATSSTIRVPLDTPPTFMDSTPCSVILPRWHALNRYRGRAVYRAVAETRLRRERRTRGQGERASEREGDAHVPNVYECPKTSGRRSIAWGARAKRDEGQQRPIPIDRLIDCSREYHDRIDECRRQGSDKLSPDLVTQILSDTKTATNFFSILLTSKIKYKCEMGRMSVSDRSWCLIIIYVNFINLQINF